MENDVSLKEEVEAQIMKYTLHAKNFSKDEMDYVDEFCKTHYDDNRHVMILDLINYKDNNLMFELVDNKINLIYKELITNIEELSKKIEVKSEEDNKEKEPIGWKGFGNKK